MWYTVDEFNKWSEYIAYIYGSAIRFAFFATEFLEFLYIFGC